jgi:aspartyl-tRNA(Asn)/glutamyl-tRNA(Gln) amidotransferase subunit A
MAEAPLVGLDAPLADRALKIGYFDVTPDPKLDPAYAPAWEVAREVLRAAGASFELVTLPPLAIEEALTAILLGEIWAALEDFGRERARQMYDRQSFDDKLKAWIAMGVRADDYVKATRIRTQTQRAFHALFDQFDVIVGPGNTDLPPPADKKFDWPDIKSGYRVIQAAGNLIGLPAITFPMGFTAAGLPLAIHAVAAPYEDHKVIALAEAYQARTDFHQRRPPPG